MSKRKRKVSDHVVIDGDGIGCPRCGRPTEIREHVAVTEKHLRKPYYYSRWYFCRYRDCGTWHVMLDEHRVYRRSSVGSQGERVPPDQPVLWTDAGEVPALVRRSP